MQIIIPMSGVGQRFIDAGYKVPKPLIEIDGKTIIEHVVNLFPRETDFHFICNSDHLKNTHMKSVIQSICPSGTIHEIQPHKKGPVFAVSQIFDKIDDQQEVIVNYCDFSSHWNYHDFLKHTRNRKADGAIPAYRHFHPHMLGSTNYAFMRHQNQWMLEIQEKKPFTDNRMQEFASNGTYYFKSGRILKDYFQQTMDQDLNLNGEYYVSVVYNLLVQSQLKVSIYEIQHMLQWGTPEDVEEYSMWSNIFRTLSAGGLKRDSFDYNIVIPMAGQGSRFQKEGYTIPKPLIEVSGQPMVIQAVNSLPKGLDYHFICQKQHLKEAKIEETIVSNFKNCTLHKIDLLTQGQACTVEIAVNEIQNSNPILIGACDNAMLWNQDKWSDCIADAPDVIVWSFTNYPGANKNPQMYGWTQSKGNYIDSVSVKTPISDSPKSDHGIVGTFYFKNKNIFKKCLEHLYQYNIRVNNEFYVDSMVQSALALNLKVKSFVIDYYLCFGTPNDLKTFEYWQSFFHKCEWHPYQIQNDPMVCQKRANELISKAVAFKQEFNGK